MFPDDSEPSSLSSAAAHESTKIFYIIFPIVLGLAYHRYYMTTRSGPSVTLDARTLGEGLCHC
jgi:hypothetical protein